MADKKIIAVVGATGAQGGGLVRAILEDPAGGFTARAITRDVNSEKAKALAQAGAEVVAADVDDAGEPRTGVRGRVRRLLRHLFLGPFLAREGTGAGGGTGAGVARRRGWSTSIWSTLEDTRPMVPLGDNRMPTLMGKYKVPHFDAKGEANHFFTDAGVPTTILLTSFYWDNFIYFGMGPKKGPDGKLTLALPMGDTRLPGIAAEDIGRCAYGVFKDPSLIGKKVGIAGEHLTGAEMAAWHEQGAGQEVGSISGAVRSVSRPWVPRSGRPRKHVPVQARFQRDVCCRAQRGSNRASCNRRYRNSTSGWPKNASRMPLESCPVVHPPGRGGQSCSRRLSAGASSPLRHGRCCRPVLAA